MSTRCSVLQRLLTDVEYTRNQRRVDFPFVAQLAYILPWKGEVFDPCVLQLSGTVYFNRVHFRLVFSNALPSHVTSTLDVHLSPSGGRGHQAGIHWAAGRQ